jgi:hypothetical protein
MPRRGISKQQLKEILDRPFYNNHPRGKESKARVEDELARGPISLQKPNKQRSLVRKKKNPDGMVHIPGPLHCRIIRNIPKTGRIYDNDNYSGGLKECRDGIAAMLGLKGDSPEDGITFEYIQRESPSGVASTEIEIYQIEEN